MLLRTPSFRPFAYHLNKSTSHRVLLNGSPFQPRTTVHFSVLLSKKAGRGSTETMRTNRTCHQIRFLPCPEIGALGTRNVLQSTIVKIKVVEEGLDTESGINYYSNSISHRLKEIVASAGIERLPRALSTRSRECARDLIGGD